MHADPADQQRLLRLVDLDAEYARLQHTARSLPEHEHIKTLSAQRAQLLDELVGAETRVDDLKSSVRAAEADLVPVRSRLERDRTRIDDGSISNPGTLRELLREVERLEQRIVELEVDQLELMEQFEQAEQSVAQLTTQRDDIEQQLRSRIEQRDARLAELKTEAQATTRARKLAAEQVPEALLSLYESLRARTGQGAARLHRGRCTGCQLELTLADADRYRKAGDDQVLRCAECDRILVKTAESGL